MSTAPTQIGATTTMRPTPEQDRVVALALTGDNLAIEAGAGTGKTTTLMQIAAALTPKRGQYIAFNGAIVKESASKFPRTVRCNTAHSLAFRAVGKPYAERLDGSARMRSLDVAIKLGIEGVKVTTYEGVDKQLSKSFLASHAMESVKRFCQSTDEAPSYRHVARIPGLDDPMGSPTASRQVARYLEPALRKIWADWTNQDGSLRYSHDAYLKLWQLSDPRIGAEYILFDECQDANPVMADIVFRQQDHAQLIFVGDSQQQIYGFTGAINSLAKIRDTGCATAFLTQSFRFGPAVAQVANDILAVIPDAELRLRGTETIPSRVVPVDEPDAVLTRTNAAAVRIVLDAVAAGRKVYLQGGTKEITAFAKAAQDLMEGRRTEHPELACFESWDEVHEYVEQDEQGSDLKLLVKLIDDFTVEVLLAELAKLPKSDADADLVVSTAHKSKGREWDTVQLGPDFPDDENKLTTDELRLLYVACTRARIELDITAVTVLSQGLVSPAEAAPVVDDTDDQAEAPEALQEIVSAHVGQPGERISLPLRCEVAIGMDTAYGWTHLTTLVDDSTGNVYSAFLKEELTQGASYQVDAKVKGHGEHRGTKQTKLNYVDAEIIDEPVKPAPVAPTTKSMEVF